LKARGITRGNRKKHSAKIIGKPMYTEYSFPENTIKIYPSKIENNYDPYVNSICHNKIDESQYLSAFEPFQVLVKQSWQKSIGRFRAVLVDSEKEGVLCSDSYLSIHSIVGLLNNYIFIIIKHMILYIFYFKYSVIRL